MKERKYNWHKVAESLSELKFSSNGTKEIEVAGKVICVSFKNDHLYACTQKCPHASGKLAEGYVDNFGNIVCPLHRYRFSLSNGRNTSGEGYFLKTFPIEIRKEGVFVGFNENNGFN